MNRLFRAPKWSLETRDAWFGVALITPTLLLFGSLIALPLVQGILLSFQSANTLTRESHFIGIQNYVDLFAELEFWVSLANTLIWSVSALALQIIIGVTAALMLHQNLVFRSLARGLILFPYLLPAVVAVLVWQWVFNDLYGILNSLLMRLGLIDAPIIWLGKMPQAMISVVLVGTWKFFPFVVIAVLARLQTIPVSLYEAARLDGASAWARFWDVTLPQLRGVLLIVTLLRFIWDFKEFDLIFLLTGGGPVISTQTLPLMVYKYAFALLQMGRAAAVAVAMLLFMLLLFLLYFCTFRSQEQEAGR
jgi:multiple sugar transport system permease protein